MPTTQTITFDLGVPRPVDGVRMGADGQVELMLGDEVVTPVRAWTGGQRERVKGGEKALYTLPLAGNRTHVHELGALAEYDYFFVLDTNTDQVDGVSVSVTSIAVCSAWDVPNSDSVKLVRKTHAGAIEFRALDSEQERFGWVLLQHAILNGPGYDPTQRYLIISDHALDLHHAINERTEPLFRNVFLAANISIGFATSDSGAAFVQKTIRECDGFARKILKKIKRGEVSSEGLRETADAPVSHLRLYQYQQPAEIDPLTAKAPVYQLSGDFPY